MLKADVVAIGIIFGHTGHALFVLNLLHTLDAHLAGEHRGHVGKHGADGVIYTGGGDEEHQKRDQRQIAAAHQRYPREDGGGDTQLQEGLCRRDYGACEQLAPDGVLLRLVQPAVQVGDIPRLLVARLDLRRALQHLLHGVGGRAAGDKPLRYMPLFHAPGEIDHQQRRGHHPQKSQRHPPVVKQHACGNQRRGEERAVHGGVKVGECLFQRLRIPHDGGSQVGQVTVSEEGQRELAQHLRQPDAAVGTLPVGGFV